MQTFLLEFQNKLDFEGKENIIGQAYFLRAYYAFELTKFFGDIPLLIDSSGDRIMNKRVQNGDQFNMSRASGTVGSPGSLKKLFSLIAEDLRCYFNAAKCSSSNFGAATKGAAIALLGKVLLYDASFDDDPVTKKEKFAESASRLEEVIQSGHIVYFHMEMNLILFGL